MVNYSNGFVTVRSEKLNMYFRVPYDRWLKETQSAIQMRLRSPNARPTTPQERVAALWLHANDLTTATKQQAFLARLEAIQSGADDSQLVRCKKCTRVLSDPLSKALGYGPECRKK